MKEKFQELIDWGCAFDEALARFVGDEDLYASCLGIFEKDENFAPLDQALKEKNYDAAFEYAHTIKGVSGNLGLKPLFASTDALVSALRHHEYTNLDELHNTMQKDYDDFCSIAKKITG